MTILETFYLLFKSDASGAKNDIAALDKQISALAAKGKKISDDELKQLKELSKQRQEQIAQLKEQEKQTDALGRSFVNVAEAATGAATAILSLGAIKAGVMNAAQLNSSLEVQSKLLGQNAGQMKAYAAAVESAGGTQQGFLSFMQSTFNQASASRIALPKVGQLMQIMHDNVRGLSPEKASQRFQAMGVSDPGLQSLLMQSDAEFAKSIAGATGRTATGEDSFKTAREAEKALADASQSLNNVFTTLGNQTLPMVTKALEGFSKFLDHLANNPAEAVGATAAAAIGASWLGSKTLGVIGNSFRSGGSLVGGVLNVGKTLSRGLGVIGAIPLIGEVAWWGFGKEEEFINDHFGPGSAINNWWNGSPGKTRAGSPKMTRAQQGSLEKQAYEFWRGEGYGHDAAAAWVANMRGESNGDIKARGDGGISGGLYQWSIPRRNAIYKATGIDVWNASFADQLRGAAWEAKSMKLKVPNDPSAAGYIVRNFEFTKNPIEDTIKRTRYAAEIANANLSLASSSPLNSVAPGGMGGSKSTNVTISGDINVHTQATDVEGIARGILSGVQKQFQNAAAYFDDGVKY